MDGLGKTTLIRQMSNFQVDTIFEVEPNNALIKQTLEMFYENRIDSFFYQTIFLYSNIERYQSAYNLESKNDLIISDRSFLEDIIFAEALLDKREFEYFKRLFQIHIEKVFEKYGKPSAYIFLEGLFETSVKRTNKRSIEQAINLNGKNFFDHNMAFYKKLYEVYRNKNSFFYQEIKKHDIKFIGVNTDNLATMEVFNKIIDLFKNELREIVNFPL